MASRTRRSGHRSTVSTNRRNAVLLCLGVILLLALVAGFMWLISSPQLLQRE